MKPCLKILSRKSSLFLKTKQIEVNRFLLKKRIYYYLLKALLTQVMPLVSFDTPRSEVFRGYWKIPLAGNGLMLGIHQRTFTRENVFWINPSVAGFHKKAYFWKLKILCLETASLFDKRVEESIVKIFEISLKWAKLVGKFSHFIPLISFYTLVKHQKTRGFQMFSGGGWV